MIGGILGAGVAGADGYPYDCGYYGSFGYPYGGCADYGYGYDDGYGWPYYGGFYGYGPGFYGYGRRYGNYGVGHGFGGGHFAGGFGHVGGFGGHMGGFGGHMGGWRHMGASAATWAGLAAACISLSDAARGNARSGPAFNSYRRAALRDASRKSDRKGSRHDYQRYLGHCARYGRPRFISSFGRLRGYARAGGA